MEIRAFIIVITIILAGCATDRATMRIDGSTQESTNKSLKQMSEQLTPYEFCQLKAAILRIQLGDVSTWQAGKDEQQDADPLGNMVNGMSFAQIIDLAQRYPDKVGSSCQK